MRRMTFVGVLILVGVMAASVGALAADPIIIGITSPLSGGNAFDGQDQVRGAQLAVDLINEQGGLLGRTVRLVVEDNGAIPAEGVATAEKLIVRDGAIALLGAFTSSVTGAVMPVAERYQVPLVTAISTSPSLTQDGNEWFFQAIGTSGLYASAFAEELMNQMGFKRFAYLVENGEWGRGILAEFSAAVTANGGENVTQQIFNHSELDLYTYLTIIRNSRPDAMVVAANTGPAIRITQQVRELNIDVPLIGEGGWTTPTYVSEVGDIAHGVFGIVEYIPSVDTPENEAFVTAYRARYGGEPSKYAASGYIEASLVLTAIAQAGSDDPRAVRDALRTVEYVGPNGPIRFASNGSGYGMGVYLVELVDGELQLVLSATVPEPQVQ